jgi:LmbE family N-acetylglucosaminyl deacetylase
MTAIVAQVALAASLAQAPGVPRLSVTISRATRLLVVAPHPDDGVLGAGGLIRRVISRGGRVRVVWTTSGDGFPRGVASAEGIGLSGSHLTSRDYQSYGLIREHEARAALESLGVHPASLTFLGFPDDGLCQLASAQPSTDAQVFKSPYTSRISPPAGEQIIRGVQYRGLDLRRELERVVVAFRPTLIVVPHPADEHPDHCSTHIFLDDAIERLAGQGWSRPHVLHYLIHYRGWPLAGQADRGDLVPPAGFPTGEGRWVSLSLTPDEAASKREAILAHHSQLLVIGPFMLAFARTNELFLEGEPPAPKCWCNGENIATVATPLKGRYKPPAP